MASPISVHRSLAAFAFALAAGSILHAALGPEPTAWLAWIAPVPLLVLAFSIERRWLARAAVLLAALVAASSYSGYFRLVMPLPAAVLATLGTALSWWAVVMGTRAVVRSRRGGWAVLAYPTLWSAVDTLQAALLPDGNWGSLAYSQADFPAVLQLASLAGTAGIVFVLCLVPSTLAVLIWRRGTSGRPLLATSATALVVLAALGLGWWRLQQPAGEATVRVGLASIDDAIGPHASPAYAGAIVDRYEALVARLATQGATLVVLPEKIAILAPDAARQWQQRFGEIAARHGIWLEVGIAIDDGRAARNYAWLFDPAGTRVENYEKHHLAPPERAQRYASGDAWNVHAIGGARYGLAICKDMHFAALGRGYGRRDAAVMLVPAWDFAYRDAWMGARMTLVRGVESGYAVVRSAREGLLSVSDAHGRIVAEAPSAAMPAGASLIADLPVGAALPTPYKRSGDVFGWLCVAAAVGWMLLAGMGRARRRAIGGFRVAP